MKKIYLLLLPAFLICFAASAQIVGENMLENFETVTKFRYPSSIYSGAFDSAFGNPSAAGVNTSIAVGKYVRNASVQYDVLACNLKGGAVQGVADYLSGAKKISMKVYTNAPINTPIELTLQNAAQSNAPYPTGRHSVYTGTTTVSNAWETIVFDFNNQPSTTVDANSLDQMIISFHNNSNTGDTYYFDDIAGYNIGSGPTAIINDFLWADFGTSSNLTFRRSDGALGVAPNPAVSAAHVTPIVGKYERSTVQYDVIQLSWGSQLQNIQDYKANTKKFSLNVYSPAPGTTVQFTLQDSIAAHGGYPAGRFGEFVGATTTTNQWERVVLTFTNTPDPSVTIDHVNELAVLFNSGISAATTVYVDTVYGPVFTVVANKPLAGKESVQLSPNPASEFVQLSTTLARPGTISIELSDMQGRIVAADQRQNMAAGAATCRIPVAGLQSGIYQCRVKTADGISVQRLAIQ